MRQSVQAWSDARLNIELLKVLGCTDKNEKHVYCGQITDYCNDYTASLEAQSKAIEVSVIRYVVYLSFVMWGTIVMWQEEELTTRGTPRQRAEAAYLTIIKAQP